MSRFGGYEDNPFLAEIYDLVPHYSGRRDLGFYLDLCRSAHGKVLEVGCGTGRVLIPAAEAGVEIVGLDLSPHMLSRCMEKLDVQPQEVRDRVSLTCGSMTGFQLYATFALAIVPFRPFQHLVEVEDQLSCLRCINKHLEPGGKLAFDLFQADLGKIADPGGTEEKEDVPEFGLPDGRRLRRCSRFVSKHRVEQVNEVELIYYLTDAEGSTRRLVQGFPFRYFFRYEVEHLLARCGFRALNLFGDFDKSPLRDDSPEMIFVAEKVGNVQV